VKVNERRFGHGKPILVPAQDRTREPPNPG